MGCIRVLVTALMIGEIIAVMDRTKFTIRLHDIWMFVGTGILSIVTIPFILQQSLIHTYASESSVLLVAIKSGIVSNIIPDLLYTKRA